MQLGDLTLTLVNGGNFRLDGGAMHGVVPKTLWSGSSRATRSTASSTPPAACSSKGAASAP